MEQIERIRNMEEKLNEALAAIGAMNKALEDYLAAGEDIRELEAYLTGAQWREDLAADEKGLLPPELRRGVLSEDGIFNMLEENAALLRALGRLGIDPEEGDLEA